MGSSTPGSAKAPGGHLTPRVTTEVATPALTVEPPQEPSEAVSEESAETIPRPAASDSAATWHAWADQWDFDHTDMTKKELMSLDLEDD